jgi:diguanylate cyclase (GGDEF)-like protein
MSGYWQRLFAPRDRELADAGAEGELLVARARLVMTAVILIVPLMILIEEPARQENWIGLAAGAITVLVSAAVLGAVSRGWRPYWLGFATSLYDVTVISCVLATFLIVGPPHMAVNSRTTYEVYFLAIAATCLRYDQRICIVTGLVATAQYGGIVLFAARHWSLNSAAFEPFIYGTFSASGEVGRAILMVAATLLSATIVDRNERLRVLSTHDALTALYNRAYFVERLGEELARARRYRHPLAVAIVDIDHFKRVNDTWGHDAGDAALRRVSQHLRRGMRRTDTVARYGGEEFALIFPETTADEAVAKLDGVRERLAASPISVPGASGTIAITFSGGVAAAGADGDGAEDLMTCADLRLLAAKNSGRNRITGATGLTPELR